MDLVPSSVYYVLAWIVDNDDRTQQDVPADGRKLLVRNVTTSQQVPSIWHRSCCTGTAHTRSEWGHQNMYSSLLPCSISPRTLIFLHPLTTAVQPVLVTTAAILLRKEARLAMTTIMEYFQFSVFQDMCCMILCSNGVLDATCHKHIFFCDSLSLFLCSITQRFGNFLALHVSFRNTVKEENFRRRKISYFSLDTAIL